MRVLKMCSLCLEILHTSGGTQERCGSVGVSGVKNVSVFIVNFSSSGKNKSKKWDRYIFAKHVELK